MPRIRISAGLAAGWLLVCAPAFAGGGGGVSGFATEVTQLLNNAELIEMVAQQAEEIANQLKMLDDMIRNTLALPHQVWGDTLGRLARLAQVVRDGQALAYSLSNLDQEFRTRYKGYEHYLATRFGVTDYTAQYRTWSQTNADTVRASLEAVHLQAEAFADEEATMQQLQRMSETAGGRMQAIQAGNQIAAQQVRQLQLLRQLMMTQMQMQGAYLASDNDLRAAEQAYRQQLFNSPSGTVVGDEKRF
jgi:P-type conjugative transfer protein TrbJ